MKTKETLKDEAKKCIMEELITSPMKYLTERRLHYVLNNRYGSILDDSEVRNLLMESITSLLNNKSIGFDVYDTVMGKRKYYAKIKLMF